MEADTITIDKHFMERIRARMINGEKMTDLDIKCYVLDAIDFGLKMCDVMNLKYKQYLIGLRKKYNHTCDFRILDGYVYVFDAFTSTAITIYPVPYWATYEKNYS